MSSRSTPLAGTDFQPFSHRGRLILGLLCLLGLVLRLLLQEGRAFEGDELGSLSFIQESYGHLLSTFRDQLTMNYYLVVLKALSQTMGENPWVLTLPSILAGVGTIWLIAQLTLRLADERLALCSACLVACNPCLIIFSTRIRSYMLLVALSIGAILAYYDWARERSWKHGWRCALWSCGALLMHPNALYQMSFIIVMLGTELWQRRERALSFLVPMGLAAALVLVAYLPIRADMAIFRERWTSEVPTDWSYLPDSMQLFFVGQAWMLPSLAFFGIGVWMASQTSRMLVKLGLAILVPMIMTSFMGVSHYPWTYARFLMPVLPVMLVFLARGMTYIAPRSNALLALLIGLLCITWWPRIEKEFREQTEIPFEELAQHINGLGLPQGSLYAFDPVVRARLTPFLKEPSFTTLGQYFKANAGGDGAILYVVTEKQPLETDVARENFGRLRIYRFSGANHRAVLAKLFEATAASFAAAPVAPPRLALYYEELVLMAQLFNSPLELEYTRLFYITERYDKKHRQMPEQLRSVDMLSR